MAGEKVIRRAIEAARKAVAPEDLLMGIHNTAEGRKLDMIERLGGLPAPSIAITKPSQGYASFGDISLVAPVEMVTPGRKTPVFGSDVYSPRFPNVEDDQIFRGFTPAGNRRYAPLTMENVLREMKGNVRGGESFNYGPASIRAQVTPQFGSLPEMQAAREKIIPSSEFGAQKDMSAEMMERLRERFEPYFKPTDSYRRSWSAFPEVLTDYARTGRPSEFAYDYKDLPAEALTDARSFLSHLRDMPTEYFEAKPQRAVPLSEFSGAVVPADVPGSVVDRIRNMGINRIEEYGDDASRAAALMKFVGEQGFADGGEVRDDFDKGGLARRAIDAARRVMGYTDPQTKRIEDWQWRPLSEVDKELGLREIPPHVQNFGDYMREMSDKAGSEGLSARDLIKGFTTTRASIQRQAVDADKLRNLGLDLPSDVSRIRPEGAWAEWLMTPMGQRYLDAAAKGTVEGDAVANAIKIMSPFGRHETDIPDAMRWAAQNLPGREARASDLVARAAQGASSPAEWREFTSDIRGVGPSKSGFLASLYGRGDQPTLDARQIILNTGAPTKEAAKYIARGGGEGGVEAVERLAARQRALGLDAPQKYDPFYQHLAHHAIWDKASNETTTHADVVNAMRNAAIVLGTPAAGAALMSDEAEARERASGGRLLEDQYPTQYLPNVGRQVMADGGSPASGEKYEAMPGFFSRMLGLSGGSQPEADIQQYENRMRAIAQQPADIQSMTHAPSKPMRPIEIEGGFIGKRQLGEAPYDVAGPLSGMAQTAYSLKTVPFYFTPAAPFAAAADFGEAAIDTKSALDKGDYLGAGVTGALGVAAPALAYRRQAGDAVRSGLEAARRFVAGNPGTATAVGAGAAVMTPEEAEASKANIVRRGLEAVTRTNPPPLPRSMTLDEVRRTFDPQAGVGMSPREIDLLTDAYSKVASPAMMDPELAQRGQEIAQGYITKRGSEFGGRSFFNQEPSVPLEELGRATTSIPVSSELRPIVEKSWQQVARERQGSPVITLGGDLSDWNRIVGYGPQDNLYALSRPSDIHAGFDYMREPNPYTVWANNLEHAAILDKKVQQQKDILRAVDKDLPIMATAAPMGPQSIDSAKNMMDMLLSAIEGRGIHPEYLKDATKYLKSGAFGNTRKAKEAYKKKMEEFPGFENPEEARQFLLNNPEVAGTVRGDIVKGLERKGWVKKGFPEIGQLRYAASSPQFGLAAGNLMGGRMVEIDPALFGRAMKDKMFSHMTYPGDTFGRYYADVPLVHRQYGAPDAMDELMVKYNQWRPGAKKSDPPKPPITVHPFSLQQSGRDTVRKMFEEQRMVQRINERMLESIERGEQRRPLYGFKDGGNVANHAINLAREINSSPREETVP